MRDSAVCRSSSRVAFAAWLSLGGLFALALALRLIGIHFGLPLVSNYYIRPDESLIVGAAVHLMGHGGHPGMFAYPALLPELCAAAAQAALVFLHALGWAATLSVPAHFATDPGFYFLAGRLVSALASAGSVVLTFLIARRWAGVRVAWGAGLLLACAPLAVREAHYATTDTLLVFFCMLFLWTCAGWLNAPQGARPAVSWLAAMGVAAGLAAASKYNAAMLMPLGALAVVLRPGRRLSVARLTGCVGFAVLAAAVFLLLNPYVWLDRETFRAALGSTYDGLSIFQGGRLAVSPFRLLAHYLMPLRYGPGETLGAALAAGGMLAALWRLMRGRLEPLTALLLAAFVLFSAPLLATRYLPYRYALALLPLMALFAGRLVVELLRRTNPRRRGLWITLAALLLLGPGLMRSVWMGALLKRTDTRTLGGAWIQEHVPSSMPVVFACTPECEPQVPESRASLLARVDYAHRLYGPWGGPVVSMFYQLLLQGEPPQAGYQIIRNPAPDQLPAGPYCLVTARHPLLEVEDGILLEAGVNGFDSDRLVNRMVIPGLKRPMPPRSFERIDAFFLPMSRLWRVIRPGPDVTLEIREHAVP